MSGSTLAATSVSIVPTQNGSGFDVVYNYGTPTNSGTLTVSGIPKDGSVNPFTAPIAGWSLVGSCLVNVKRSCVYVYNNSGQDLQIILDDGNATAGTIVSFILAGGDPPPSQGSNWQDIFFKGRVRVFSGSASAQISIWEIQAYT